MTSRGLYPVDVVSRSLMKLVSSERGSCLEPLGVLLSMWIGFDVAQMLGHLCWLHTSSWSLAFVFLLLFALDLLLPSSHRGFSLYFEFWLPGVLK